MATGNNIFYYKQSSFAGGEISPDGWGRDDLAKYAVSAKTLKNFFSHPFGGASNRPGTQYIAESKSNGTVRVVPFKFSSVQDYILEFGHHYVRVYKDGGQVLNGDNLVEITTNYADTEVFSLKFAQSADTLYICHPNHKPATLTRSSHYNWTLADFNFKNGPFRTQNISDITITPSNIVGDITLTASGAVFEANHIGSLFLISQDVTGQVTSPAMSGTWSGNPIRCKGTWTIVTHGTWKGAVALHRSYDNGATWETIRQYTSPDGNYNVNDTGTIDDYCLIRLACDIIAGTNCVADLTAFSFANDGVVLITGVTDATNATATVLTPLAFATATKNWAEGAWSNKNGYPTCVKFFQNRLCFGGSISDPLTVWMSQPNDYTNYATNFPSTAADAITAPLVSQGVNVIRSMVSLTSLLAFTAGGLWKIHGGNDVAVSPTSTVATQQEYGGASDIEPIVIKNRVVYCQEMGSIISDVGYSFADDTYMGDDLSILVRHLLRGYSIVDWAYQREPDSILWLIRNDGVLLSLTYNKAQQVYAWAKHDTDGFFESAASIPGQNGDEVWFVVKRIIGGNVKRFIERLSTVISTDPRQQFYVDSGLTLDNPIATTMAGSVLNTPYAHNLNPGDLVDATAADLNINSYKVGSATETSLTLVDMDTGDATIIGQIIAIRKVVSTISGLSHLEGKTVSILADGGVQPPKTVVDGSILLDYPASVVHAGLPYVCELETLNIDFPLKDGTIQGRSKRIPQLTIRLEKSRGGWVGINNAKNLKEFKTFLPKEYGDPSSLVTGDVTVVPYSANSTDARILIRQIDPLPITVLNIMAKVEIIGDYSN